MNALIHAIGKMVQQAEANERPSFGPTSVEALQLMAEAKGIRFCIDLACEALLVEEGQAVSGVSIAATRDRCLAAVELADGCRHTIGSQDPHAELRREMIGLQTKILSGHGTDEDCRRVQEIKAMFSAA